MFYKKNEPCSVWAFESNSTSGIFFQVQDNVIKVIFSCRILV